MGFNERTPLRGSQEHVPYVFMTDPNRAYKKKVRQLQCCLCTGVLGVFALALLVSILYSVDNDDEDIFGNGTMALKLKSVAPQDESDDMPDNSFNEMPSGIHIKKFSRDSLMDDEDLQLKGIGDLPCQITNDENIPCIASKYRSSDGYCNNFRHSTTWGVSSRPFLRLLPPEYCDGKSLPRCSLSNELRASLPSTLSVASGLQKLLEKDNLRNSNLIFLLWTKFLQQDLADTEVEEKPCCGDLAADSNVCFPIRSSDDNTTCISHTRTGSIKCSDGRREQLNKATSYLDGSVLYGSSENVQKKLRKFVKGHLVLYTSPENLYLPVAVDNNECEISKSRAHDSCDNSVSCLASKIKMPSINLLLARHHNDIATQLNLINPHWDDEKLFQEAKRIVVGQIQHITYNEYIGITLAANGVSEINQNIAYDETVDPTISNVFAASVLNIHHLISEVGDVSDTNATIPCRQVRLAHHLQRERDHGIPGYNQWRAHCGHKTLSNFDDLTADIGMEAAEFLRKTYTRLEDIDLSAGILAELLTERDDLLGPVSSCITADQLRRLKIGDRFWYESDLLPQRFSAGQLKEIKKTTLSKIVCDQLDNMKMVPFLIMKDTDDNPSLLCSTMPSLNLTLWQENVNNSNENEIVDSSNSKQGNLQQVGVEEYLSSGSRYVQKFLLQAKAKSNISKVATSFAVNIANITGHIGNETIIDMYYAKPPFTIPLDNVADTSAYTPSANAIFSATYDDDMLEGSLTLPLKNMDNFQKGSKSVLKLDFTIGVTLKWNGVFSFNQKKTYNCKLMFQSYSKASNLLKSSSMSNLNLKEDDSGEQCNILLVGTYYKKPFYCPLTPWWCSDSVTFYWSGEAKLIFTKPAPMALRASLKNYGVEAIPEISAPGETEKPGSFASFSITSGKVIGNFNGDAARTILDGTPPFTIPLASLTNASSSGNSVQISWSAAPSMDGSITGQFTLPSTKGPAQNDSLSGNFSFNIAYDSEEFVGIIQPSRIYTCIVTFHKSQDHNLSMKLINTRLLPGNTPVPCVAVLNGMFSETSSGERAFVWDGKVELIIKSKALMKSSGNIPSPQIPSLGKTEDVVVSKTFASVTVLRAKVSGHFNGEEDIEVFNGSPPVDIYLDNFVNPNAVDTSIQATWSGTPSEDRTVAGTFTVAYYPSIDNYSERRQFTADYSVDVVYKYGGSIGIIDPSKTYTCKTMFQENKKLTSDQKLHEIDPTVPMKGKTPFGESCSVTLSGTFVKPSVFCALTPWWCSKEKIFRWSGDLEIAFKYKYNSTDESVVKKSIMIPQKNNLGALNNVGSIRSNRFGGQVVAGWIQVNNGGLFEGSKTIWSGQIPYEIELPIFWTPGSSVGNDISEMQGHAVLWSASIFQSTIQGTFAFPQHVGNGPSSSINWINGKFSFQIKPHQFGSLFNVLYPSTKYQSNIYFHNEHSPNDIEFLNARSGGPGQSDQALGINAPIILLGRYTKTKNFIWNGTFIIDVKNSATLLSTDTVKRLNQYQIAAKTQSLLSPSLGKTEDVVVSKTFASVTVLRAKVSGHFNGEEDIEVFNGSPPVDIYLDNFVNPNAVDTSIQTTWSGTPSEDRTVAGTFTVAYYPSIDNYSERRQFTADYSVDVVYKYGGSIGIIDPSKTYTCKTMFQENKKLTSDQKLHEIDPTVPMKGKTPFGESCSVTLSGTFVKPSVFCALTPWWCSKEKIFRWSGDLEIAFKYKYNSTEKNEVKKSINQKSAASSPSSLSSIQDNALSHRYGGRAQSGWVQVKNGGLFSGYSTVWSGEIPFEIKLPIFWAPTNDDDSELSDTYGHQILWSATIFQSNIQGTFSLPQYIGHSSPGSLKWIKGKFSFQLEPNRFLSLYDLLISGVQYKSNIYFHNSNSSDLEFAGPAKSSPTQQDVGVGIRAPIILLGRYTGNKSFVWNGSFIIDVARTARDYYYG